MTQNLVLSHCIDEWYYDHDLSNMNTNINYISLIPVIITLVVSHWIIEWQCQQLASFKSETTFFSDQYYDHELSDMNNHINYTALISVISTLIVSH